MAEKVTSTAITPTITLESILKLNKFQLSLCKKMSTSNIYLQTSTIIHRFYIF